MPLRRAIPWKSVLVAAAVFAALGAAACGSGAAAASRSRPAGASLPRRPSPLHPVRPPRRARRLPRSSPAGPTAGSRRSSCSAACRRRTRSRASKFARMGVGGIVILGGGARSSIGGDLAAVLRAAPHGVKPFIASDEEGGQVQRLRYVIYPLPSARVQGGWSASKTRATAKDYGARLRKLHVSVVFGPVADLDIPGRYMSSLDRCFSSRPDVVGEPRRGVGERPPGVAGPRDRQALARSRLGHRHAQRRGARSPRSRCCAATTWCRSSRRSTPACRW